MQLGGAVQTITVSWALSSPRLAPPLRSVTCGTECAADPEPAEKRRATFMLLRLAASAGVRVSHRICD